MAGTDVVKGMTAAIQQAEAGLKLFQAQQDGPLELDLPAAEQYKAEMEARIAALEAEAALLTGKDNKKERTAKGKEVSELKAEAKYVDACKVVKGLEPRHGNFLKNPKPATCPDAKREPKPPAKEEAAPAPAEDAKKKETKPKKQESAGLSPAETRELEQLKKDIIDRKAQLKDQGMSGGQQNKDPQVVEWVNRMNELKEKAEPGSTQKDAGKKKETKKSRAPLSAEEQKEMAKLQQEVEVYKHKLKTEFGYSKKDMLADPDLVEMEERLAALERREG